MTWIRREDGFDAAHAAHPGEGFRNIVRDRSVPPGQPDTLCMWAFSLQSGDTEITAEAYDTFCDTMTIQNYERHLIPAIEAAIVEAVADNEGLLVAIRERKLAGLKAELAQYKEDATGDGIRAQRERGEMDYHGAMIDRAEVMLDAGGDAPMLARRKREHDAATGAVEFLQGRSST
jgi:hypothetical protein